MSKLAGLQMKKHLTAEEIRTMLKHPGLQVTVQCNYVPSSNPDEAAYQELDFLDRTWKRLVLKATNRAKISKQLIETQTVIERRPDRLDKGRLKVRVLTLEAAVNLQRAGYELQVAAGADIRQSRK